MAQELTIVTPKELSEILKLSTVTINRMVKDGRLPPDTYLVVGELPRGGARRRFILEKVLEALGKEGNYGKGGTGTVQEEGV